MHPWSRVHLLLIKLISMVILTGALLAVGIPRGFGKTSMCVRAVIWAIAYKHHSLFMVVAATNEDAAAIIEDIKAELTGNELLRADFPEICIPLIASEGINQKRQLCCGEPTSVYAGSNMLRTGDINGEMGACIWARGITASGIRGTRRTYKGRVYRPTCGLVDDGQTRASAGSDPQITKRKKIMEADMPGLPGPSESWSCLSTWTVIEPDDVADWILNRELAPDWYGVRERFLDSLPNDAAMELWSKWNDIRIRSQQAVGMDFDPATWNDDDLAKDTPDPLEPAHEFYDKNKKAMHAGAKVVWKYAYDPERYRSALEKAMHWYFRNKQAFLSELQNAPEAERLDGKEWLSAKEIALKTHGQPRGTVPQSIINTRRLIEHVDVHDDILYWALGALAADGTAGIIDYNTYPDQKRSYFKQSDARRTMEKKHPRLGLKGAIRASLLEHCRNHLDRVWLGEDGHTEFQLDLLLIDCGHEWKLVNNVVLELLREPRYRNRLMMCRGFGVGPADTPMAERRHPEGTALGNHCMERPRAKKTDAPRFDLDTNYWKTETHDRWAAGYMQPGCLTLFDDADHQLFSEHQKAEFAVETDGKGRTVYVWKKLPNDNHWFDNVVDLLAGGSYRGCDHPANVMPTPRKRRKKRRRTQVTL